jgi:hypothetical protein
VEIEMKKREDVPSSCSVRGGEGRKKEAKSVWKDEEEEEVYVGPSLEVKPLCKPGVPRPFFEAPFILIR